VCIDFFKWSSFISCMEDLEFLWNGNNHKYTLYKRRTIWPSYAISLFRICTCWIQVLIMLIYTESVLFWSKTLGIIWGWTNERTVQNVQIVYIHTGRVLWKVGSSNSHGTTLWGIIISVLYSYIYREPAAAGFVSHVMQGIIPA